jgi:hypothetical protein
MKDRARKSKLNTYKTTDNGSSFLGSTSFPPSLVAAVIRSDPKGILFGLDDIPAAPYHELSSAEQQDRLRRILDARLKDKRIIVCSGAEDKLVPYAISRPFLEFLTDATREGGWYGDGGLSVENFLYDGVGHTFSEGMMQDSVRFLVDVLDGADRSGGAVVGLGVSDERSKI